MLFIFYVLISKHYVALSELSMHETSSDNWKELEGE